MPTYFDRPLRLLEVVRAARLIAVVDFGRAEDIKDRFPGFKGLRYDVRLTKVLKDAGGRRELLPLLVLSGAREDQDDEDRKVASPRRRRASPHPMDERTSALLFAVRYDGMRDVDDEDGTEYIPYLGALLPIRDGEVSGGDAVDLDSGGKSVPVDDLLAVVERLIAETERIDQEWAREGAGLATPGDVAEIEPEKGMLEPAVPEPAGGPRPEDLHGPAGDGFVGRFTTMREGLDALARLLEPDQIEAVERVFVDDELWRAAGTGATQAPTPVGGDVPHDLTIEFGPPRLSPGGERWPGRRCFRICRRIGPRPPDPDPTVLTFCVEICIP